MNRRLAALAAVLTAWTSASAAGVGENLIRDDFAGNGVGGILDWTVCRSLGGVCVERLAEKGPGGKPVLRLQGGIGDFSFDHTQSTFVPGEPYRLSVKVRTHGFDPKTRQDFEAYNNGWRKSVIARIPADTKGEWVEVFWEGKMIESRNNAFTCAFYFKSMPSGAWCDISEPSMVALSEKGAAGSSSCPTTKPFVPRITPVEPLLCEIDSDYAWLDFFYPGDIDREKRYELTAETCGRRVTAALDAASHAKVVFGGIPEGTHALAVSVRETASGQVLATNAYEIVARKPSAATVGRKLNNFVTELKREPLKDGSVEFSLARDGWVFVGFDRPYAGVTVDVDDSTAAVRPRDGEPSQTMRYLKAGRHVVTVRGAADAKDGWIFVRSVKMMMFGFGRVTPKTNLNIYGGYGVDFFKAFGAYGCVNTPSLPEWLPTRRPEVVADLLDRGCQILGSLALGSRSSVRNDLALFKSKVTSHPVWQKEQPIIIDENGIGADSLMKYNSAEVLWETGRGNHRIDVCIEDAVRCTFSTPAREIPELSALVNAGYGTSHMVPETYVPTMEDEADVQVVKDYWKDFSRRAGALVPAAPGRMVYLIGGWVWQGVFNPWYAPDVDIKEYYDDFIHMLATDPAFAEIGGIGFSTPACDEGLFRFMMHAIRHYCVDGATERLSPRYGWKYKPGIVDNGDFTDGFAGWTAASAEEGSLAIGHSKNFGKAAGGQVRQYNAYKLPKTPYGDDFAVFTKSAKGVNRLGRTLVNLTPGLLYELTFCTYDVNEIEKKGKAVTAPTALSATVEGAETIPELAYLCLGDPRKGVSNRPAAIMHRVVFRATAETAKLTIDDAANAAVGTRRALNYIGARPYFVRDAQDLEKIREFGKNSK